MCSSVAFLLVAFTIGQTPAEGRRVSLADEATLFIPEGYKPRDGRLVDVVVQLHGAGSVVESALVETRWPSVLIEFNRKGLSSVYTKPFTDPSLFPRLLDSAIKAVDDAKIVKSPRTGRVVVSSFSAGFGGVREILKNRESYARIDGLIMADSIYCGYTGNRAEHQVDPKLMDGFKRFAIEAAAGRKTLLVTHSEQVPEGYASTTETADFLIAAVGGMSKTEKIDWGRGLSQTRIFSNGKFEVLGFAGKEADDHMRHLRQVAKLWKRYRALDQR